MRPPRSRGSSPLQRRHPTGGRGDRRNRRGIKPLFGFGFGFGPSYSTFDIADVLTNAPDGANAPVTRRFPRQHCERRHLVRMLCRATFASVSVGAQARCAGRSTDSILIAARLPCPVTSSLAGH
jgi:hypothetical protein